MNSPSWRAVANQLASRMQHHAYCDTHRESEADEACPFCRDRAAYRAWLNKAGVQPAPPKETPTVNVFDLYRCEGRPAGEGGGQ